MGSFHGIMRFNAGLCLKLGILCLTLAHCSSESKPQGVTPQSKAGTPAAGGAEGGDQNPSADAGTSADGKKSNTTPKTTTSTDPNAPIPAGPTTNAVAVVNGTMTFDLGAPRPALQGAQITAEVTVNAPAAGVAGSISLRGIAVKGAPATGFVLYRPVVVTQKAGEAETMLQIGTNINQRVAKGRIVPLAQEMITVENVLAGDMIRLRFSALEAVADATNTGIANFRECKAPQNFPAMATALTPCKACHSGLFNYDFMTKDPATACGLNLKLIDASLSPTAVLPNMQRPVSGAGHPAVSTTGYSQALSTWKTGEGL